MGGNLTKETAEQLLLHSQQILDTFRSADMAVDAQADEYFEGILPRDDPVRITIVEIFAGCIKYEKALDTVITAFYNVEGRVVKRSEQNLYRVFAYLIVFRMEEFGLKNTKVLIGTQERTKIHRFLSFLLDRKNLYTWMLDEWSKLYDRSYVQSEIIDPLEEYLPQLEAIVERLRVQIEEGVKSKKTVIDTTQPQPFTLTEPKPREVPLPEEIPQLAPTRPVPSSMYEPPAEQSLIEDKRRANRQQAEQRLVEASRLQPKCAASGKSEKFHRRMEQLREEQEKELDFNSRKARPPPRQQEAQPVKLNAAAIMREWARYKEAERKEADKLRELEAGAFDKSAFEEWQKAQKEADLMSELAELERRRLEGKLSYEEAIIARRRIADINRAAVEAERAAAAEREEELAEIRAAEEEELKRRMAEIMATHAKARQAVRDLKKAKAQTKAEVQEETEALLRQAFEEAQEELQRKMQLIAEIRALEATQGPREKLVDFTATAGFGFLSEMSLVELKERLCLAKQHQYQEVEERRDLILEEKQAKDERLLQTMEQISRHRAEKTKVAAAKLEEKKRRQQQLQQLQQQPQQRQASGAGQSEAKLKDAKLSHLEQELQRKREERLALQQQDKKASLLTSKTAKTLSREKKAREAARWAQLEAAQERVAKLRTGGAAPATNGAAAAAAATKTETAATTSERFPRQTSRLACT